MSSSGGTVYSTDILSIRMTSVSRKVLIIGSVLLVAAAAFWFVTVATEPTDVFVVTKADVRPGETGDAIFTGTFLNQSDSIYTTTTFTIRLLTAEGEMLGEGSIIADTMPGHGAREFAFPIPVTGGDIAPGILACEAHSAGPRDTNTSLSVTFECRP